MNATKSIFKFLAMIAIIICTDPAPVKGLPFPRDKKNKNGNVFAKAILPSGENVLPLRP